MWQQLRGASIRIGTGAAHVLYINTIYVYIQIWERADHVYIYVYPPRNSHARAQKHICIYIYTQYSYLAVLHLSFALDVWTETQKLHSGFLFCLMCCALYYNSRPVTHSSERFAKPHKHARLAANVFLNYAICISRVRQLFFLSNFFLRDQEEIFITANEWILNVLN